MNENLCVTQITSVTLLAPIHTSVIMNTNKNKRIKRCRGLSTLANNILEA